MNLQLEPWGSAANIKPIQALARLFSHAHVDRE